MRRLVRQDLTKPVLLYLGRKQAEVNGGSDVGQTWDRARRTKSIRHVASVLKSMSGVRNRCMYCDDSRGTQIDHYWPKVRFPDRSFDWSNMLWLCGGCNLTKGDRFDLDAHGNPLLLNPTSDDPWEYLFFEPATGIITARYCPHTGSPNPRAAYTTDPEVLPLNIESVTEGRRRTCRSLRRAVERFLQAAGSPAMDHAETERSLISEIKDHDDYGLTSWYFLKDGRESPPFSQFRNQFANVWQRVVDSLSP